MAFGNVLGHAHTVELLRSCLRGDKVPHALLLSGPRGIGKSLLARTLAKALACGQAPQDSCDRCPSCKKIDGGYHPDVFSVIPEGKSNQIVIDQIRALQQRLGFKSFEGPCRVCVVEEAHTMTEQAENALLKTLEEPPPASYLFLVTDHPDRLLPTVLSRCHKIACRPLDEAVVSAHLVSTLGLDGEQARSLALLGGGSLGRALSMARREGIYAFAGTLAPALLGEGGDAALGRLEAVRTALEFFSGMDEAYEKQVRLALRKDPATEAAGKKSRDLDAQVDALVSIRRLQELENLLHFALFLLRDALQASCRSGAPLANAAHRELIERLAPARTPDHWTARIARVEDLRVNLSFNMSAADVIELLILQSAV